MCLAVSIIGVVLSLLLGRLLSVREQELTETQFTLDANRRIQAIQAAVTHDVASASTVVAFFSGSELVDRKEFQTIAAPVLKNHPGAKALAWVPRIPAARRASHERAVRGDGLSEYEITRRDGAAPVVRDVDRDVYYPITFIEPCQNNRSLLGFNLGSNRACRAAIDRAMATGRKAAAICRPLNGDSEGGGDAKLLYVVEPARNEDPHPAKRPADQPEVDGFVLGIFRLEEIVNRSLSQFAPIGIDVYITTPNGAKGETLAYQRLSVLRTNRTEDAAAAASLPLDTDVCVRGRLNVADLHCDVDCVPLKSYLAKHRTWGPAATLLTGLVITGLLTGYLLLLTGRTARVERLVAERTRALAESEERFRLLIDNAGDAFFLVDRPGTILDVSRRACETLGYTRDELLSMNIADVDLNTVPDWLAERWEQPLQDYPKLFKGLHRRKDGSTFPVEVRLAMFETGGRRLLLGLARDISERKRFEQSLSEGERKLRAILDQTYQFIGLLTPEGILTAANKTALAFSGVSEADVLGKPFWETPWWIHSPALQEELREAVKRAAQGEFVRMEVTHLAANGDLHWIDFSLKPVKDESGKVIVLIPEGRDITERKRAYEAIHKEQRLLREMLDLHEQERKLVAYEIHDGLAQHLAGAIYRLQSAHAVYGSDLEAAARLCDEGAELLREAMAETRRLIGGLRPPVLDEEGIVAAIEYLVAEHKRHEGIDIEFVHDADIERLAPPLEVALFRIVQECLTNACRYSQSPTVSVELRRVDGRMRVDVRDAGVGFNLTDVPSDHFGLRGIRERARLLGGTAVIETAPRQGTHIAVELPLMLQTENGVSA